MRNAYQQGRTIVAPMDDYDGVTWGIPNRLSRDNLVIAVGSSDLSGIDPFRYSSEGRSNSSADKTDIDLVAPGVNVLTTAPDSSNSYKDETSTTTAAAQVTGVVSLLKSADASLKPNDIREILRRTAVDIGDPGYDRKTGFGRINAQAAFDYWQEHDFTRGVATNGSSVKVADNQQVTLYHGPWGTEASGSYEADIYKVTFTEPLPANTRSNIWYRADGTLGWENSTAHHQRHWSQAELDSVNNQAIFTTYVYDLYTSAGGHIGYRPTTPSNAQVAYTIASKPGSYNIPPEPLTVSISGPQTLSQQDGIGYWSANVSGGVSPYSYQWQARNTCRTGYNCGSETWQPAGTQQTISYTYSSSVYSLELKVTVTDDQSTSTTSGIYTVYYDPPSYSLTTTGPNPFNPTTNLSYALPEQADVTMEVYNIMGRKVATLADGSKQPGRYTVRFDASHLASGMYLVNFMARTASGQITRKTMKLQLLK